MAELTILRQPRSTQFFQQDLSSKVNLEMVLIPGGTFLMGSPKDELDNFDEEQPQHQVTVPTFFMGRYPVIQAQWRAVAKLPQVDRSLKVNPSSFKGDRRPVEQVSWDDATEFCLRLSRHTKRTYRLPSEAEWEYACRAGTTTPFHFGETITPDVANYSSENIYGRGFARESIGATTPVDRYGIANAFGLCDMHGNVWEWCLDHWHNNYEGAPIDGSAWLSQEESRVLRGGSWFNDPGSCRSACRDVITAVYRDYVIGFRVVCVPPRAL
jgi:formylglycine-generating enzyme required for sulfatase activity